MALTFEQAASVLTGLLTAGELGRGVAYAARTPIPAGTRLKFPGISIEAPWEAYVGFVDGEPTANWGHACRYILIRRDDGVARSSGARFPPFAARGDLRWKVVYRAEGVPDAAIAVKE